MKTVYLTLCLLCLMACNVYAKQYEMSQLPIVVRNLPEWNNEYPTVINNWNGKFLQSIDGELPELLSVIVALNGKDTKGITEELFNELLMSNNVCNIVYLKKNNGENVKKECTIRFHKNIYWVDGITMSAPEPFPQNITMKNIKNASVFNYFTFAYKTGSIPNYQDSEVFEVAGKSLSKLGFAKTENIDAADIILLLSEGNDDFNSGKVTLTILDGRKLREGNERVLWSIDITNLNGSIEKSEKAVKTALSKYCTNFPFDMPTYSQSITTLGVAFEGKEAVSSGKTLMVLENSDAYEKGLRGGDAIIGAYAGYDCSFYWTKTRRYYFKPNKKNRQKNWGVDLCFVIPVPQFTYNNSESYLTDTKWRGGSMSRNHFKIRDRYGKKYSVYAPFEKRKFNIKFIR